MDTGIRKSVTIANQERLNMITEKAKPLLARTTNILTTYTEHTIDHSWGVEKIYDIILDENFKLLNEDEKFILIAATILHDIGMVGTEQDVGRIDEKEFRNRHHINSRKIIKQHGGYFGFNDREADLISKVAEAHRKVPLESLDESIPYGIGTSIRLRLLASLLRLADELHVTNDRAYLLVDDVVGLNPVSKMHYKRHQLIRGIDKASEDRTVIEISASVDSWSIENAINSMMSKIQDTFESVKPILKKNSIPISKITSQVDCQELVKKEILLNLANNALSASQLVEQLPDRAPSVIGYVLDSLSLESTILGREDEKWIINVTEGHFKHVADLLLNTEKAISFVQSNYVRENIEAILTKISMDIYGHSLTPGEKEDRVLLLRNSPTALGFLLDKQEVLINFGHLDRMVILDLSVLNGYMQDITVEPSLAQEEEVILAAQAVEINVHKNLGSMVRILHNVEKNCQYKESMTGETMETPQRKIVFNTVYKNGTLPHTRFDTLLKAAGFANEKISFHKDIRVSDTNDEGLKELVGKEVQLEIYPSLPKHLIFRGDFWGELTEDEEKDTLTISISRDGCLEQKDFVISWSQKSQTESDLTIKHSPLISATKYSRYLKIVNKLNDLSYRRIYITDENGNIIGKSNCLRMHSKTEQQHDLINKIDRLEQIASRPLGIPFLIDDELVSSIDQLYKTAHLMSSEVLMEGITKASQRIEKLKTTLYMVSFEDSRSGFIRKAMFHQLGWLKYESLGLSPRTSAEEKRWNETVKQQKRIKISSITHYSVENLFEQISSFDDEEFFLKQFFGLLQEKNDSNTGALQARITAILEEPVIRSWQNVQIAEITISGISDDFLTMIELMNKEKYAEALHLMEQHQDSISPENLAYAYVVSGNYTKGIELAEEAINTNFKSLAHFTRGLGYVGLKEFDKAYDAYELAINASSYDWYPKARENSVSFIEEHGIELNDRLQQIIELLSTPTKPLRRKAKCYCGSGKKFKNCHGR